jgi:uncharacterized SAM-binding protein YcdF (DUF218 family)
MLWLLHLKTLIRGLVLPPAGPLLLGAIGMALWQRRPALARTLLVVALLSLWAMSMPLLADALEALADRYPPVDLRQASAAQAIVILGGGGQRAFAPEYGGPAAGPLLLERLAYGAYLARATGLPILVTGYHVEAAAMQATLERNFDASARWVDNQSYDTFENARNSVRLLRAAGIERIVLVTHATHMRRSVSEFTSAGALVVPAPLGMRKAGETELFDRLWACVPNADALLRSYGAAYEIAGEAVRAVLAYIHLRHH